MGLLVEGSWQDSWYDTTSHAGRFAREASRYRHWISADGSVGATGDVGFKAESGRYHLYVSYACPWAHRTLLMRALKGLEQQIGVSVVHPLMREHGWTFDSDFDGATGDDVHGLDYLYQLYLRADAHYSGRVTVPTLWDKQRQTIVSNESADIMRMFNSAFDGCGAYAGDFYPQSLRHDIDAVNQRVYEAVNNGVYKAGFATRQAAYEEAATTLFEALDELDQRLAASRYLVGNTLTEADLRLWTTLVRFDTVYATHFKCDRARIADYPNLAGFLCDIYQLPGVAATLHMGHIRHHYFCSHPQINPTGIIPLGPQLNLDAVHGRDLLGPRQIVGAKDVI